MRAKGGYNSRAISERYRGSGHKYEGQTTVRGENKVGWREKVGKREKGGDR